MAGSFAARRAGRRFAAWLCLIAPCFAACSLFAPTLDEYAKTRPSVGGSGSAGSSSAGQGNAATGGDAGRPDTTGGNSGSSNVGGNSGSRGAGAGEAGVGEAGVGGAEVGEAGWTGQILIGDTVDKSDLELQPVSTFALFNVAALTDYAADESTAAQLSPPRNTPLYAPYDSTTAGWWDNLVAEQTQARLPIVLLPTHGAYSLSATDLTGPDLMNPRRLSGWLSALDRAGSAGLFQASCFVDMPSVQNVNNNLHAQTAGTLMDLSLQADWDNVIWQRVIKPWFDTVPQSAWYQQSGGPQIQFGSISASSFQNISGNLSKLLSSVAASFHAAYNISPSYVLDATWFAAEPTLSNNSFVVGENSLLTAAPAASSFATYRNLSLGTVSAGFADPTYYQLGSAGYHDPSLIVPRKTKDAYGTTVFTLDTGLAAAAVNASKLTVVQGFTDLNHWSGVYRSEAPDWARPNEYLNLLRRYNDPKTVTLRLEAEGCDQYLDTTTGNSGGVFRRSGDLDVRALSGGSGWSVTNTAPGEWLEFDGVYFSAGTYEFAAKYSTSASSNQPKRIQLLLDSEHLTPVIVPNTANVDTFSNVLLSGQRFMTQGSHNLRVRFLDGLVDLDWLFVKKAVLGFTLKSSANQYVSATNGGGSTVGANQQSPGPFEALLFDDINGGSFEDGDSIYVQAWNGMYFSAVAGKLGADQRDPGSAETFTVHAANGSVAAGSRIALMTNDNTHYLTVGSNLVIDTSGTVVGDAQLFTLGQ